MKASRVVWLNRNNSDDKARLKRQKSPETTTDTQDVSKFIDFTCKIFIFEIPIVVNRPYFVPSYYFI